MTRTPAACVLAIMVLSNGCAAMLHGTQRALSVSTQPPGARVKVDGGSTITSPGIMMVPAQKTYNLTATKEGYKEEATGISSKIYVGSVIADVLLTGLIGVIVDAATGAWYYPIVTNVELVLEPDKNPSK